MKEKWVPGRGDQMAEYIDNAMCFNSADIYIQGNRHSLEMTNFIIEFDTCAYDEKDKKCTTLEYENDATDDGGFILYV